MSMDPVAVTIFVALFAFVTLLGFVAARWRRGDLNHLHEWGLGGRRFGTVVTWFLLGGDLYTAYTFIAVPALVFGAGATGFFAVPYTILVYPLLFAVFPRLWSVAQAKGYVTAADFVRGRFGNGTLALAIAVTGIVATMPYIALQLVGMEVVIAGLGINMEVTLPGIGVVHDFPLLIAFVVLALYTYTSGLRAPALIAVVKDALLYITVIAAVIVIPVELGGFGKIFAAADPKTLILAPATATNLGPQAAYATLALGSTLALFLYPHAVTGVLSSSSRHVVRRNAVALPAYSFALGLIALLGYMAVASGVKAMPEYADGFKAFGNNFAVPALFLHMFPELVRRHRLRRHRHRRAGAGRDHVDRLRQSVHAQHLSRIYRSQLQAGARGAGRQDRVAGGQTGRAVLHHRAADAIRDPAAAAGRHLDHPDAAVGDARALHQQAQSLGAADRLGGGHGRGHLDGGAIGVQDRRSMRSHILGVIVPCYAGAVVADPQHRCRCGAELAVQCAAQRRHDATTGRRITPELVAN